MTLAQMTLSQWIVLIFVGAFLLLMVAGLVTWVVQLIRSGRRYRQPNRKKHDKHEKHEKHAKARG